MPIRRRGGGAAASLNFPISAKRNSSIKQAESGSVNTAVEIISAVQRAGEIGLETGGGSGDPRGWWS